MRLGPKMTPPPPLHRPLYLHQMLRWTMLQQR